MATISIPWETGGGNIIVEYTGEGDGSLHVYSDSENASAEERSQVLNVSTILGVPPIVLPITVKQAGQEQAVILPEGYTQVEYIQSTGTQYVDTGYAPVKITAIEVGYMFTSIPSGSYYYVFGNYNSAGKNSTRLMTNRSSGLTVINMFTATDKNNFTLSGAKAVNVRYDDIVSNTSYMTNGIIHTIGDTTEGTVNSRNLALFANYVNGRKSSLKMYYCRIKEGDTLVRDFIPCLDAGGIPCLYDTVSKETYYNDGSGKFGYG